MRRLPPASQLSRGCKPKLALDAFTLSHEQAIFQRTETELVLKSRRVVPTRLLGAGFEFGFPDWPDAARALVRRWRERGNGNQPRVDQGSSL